MSNTLERTELMSLEKADNSNVLAVNVDGLNHDLDLSDVGNFSDLMKKVEQSCYAYHFKR